ncbi:DUF7221 family queuine tRNA-ribosyltransferase-like protein [Fodinicola acaciae]|uniref:deazapurine DNA modification protein DpdA family protein n=1 Tax=Fodinicola acaciae TaxID=2681555 RepID=UPI001C9E5A22|nr:hypothetical protein [Fodinicola acaciae]
MRFYLGTHHPHWLRTLTVPLFVSDRRLRRYRTLPVAAGPWALDSGGFTELSTYGGWHQVSPRAYADRVRRYAADIGKLQWAAPQDWMVEPQVLAATGLTVAEHQRRTVANYLQLSELAPDLPFIPVLQGWAASDYLDCIQRYEDAGVNLTAVPVVGVGSVCRRQGTTEAAAIFDAIRTRIPTVRLHGFGVKTTGLARYGHELASSDSLAWSLSARRRPPLTGCRGHASCANCVRYALRWRTELLGSLLATATDHRFGTPHGRRDGSRRTGTRGGLRSPLHRSTTRPSA